MVVTYTETYLLCNVGVESASQDKKPIQVDNIDQNTYIRREIKEMNWSKITEYRCFTLIQHSILCFNVSLASQTPGVVRCNSASTGGYDLNIV